MKDVTSVTNVRTVIAAVIPSRAAGHTLPLVELPDPSDRWLLVAMLSSLPYDHLARQNVHKNHVARHIVEQLPVIPPAAYDRAFGSLSACDIILREVLHLTYTAHDMAIFARDLGHSGAPFAWDEADRRQHRVRLDVLYFHLYAADADYILSNFPIVRRQDEAAHGRYLTRDLILGHMAALAAGDPEVVIAPR